MRTLWVFASSARGNRGLVQLTEPAHARALQAPACLQEAGAALGGHLIVRQEETPHREVDLSER